ncbi:MAG: bacterioferritin [Polaribacter sp.]|jgi:bacterioferritin
MKLDPKVNQQLNSVLKSLLTGINQYFLHSRMYENWGFDTLKSKNYSYSILLMKESDKLIKRILFLQGLPNLQDLGCLTIGTDVEESLKGNMTFEAELRQSLIAAIEICESLKDYISRDCLTEILEESEEQIDWLEIQAHLLGKMGPENYLQSVL